MLDLVQAAANLQYDLDALDLPNCVIGGLALQAWGEVRLTRQPSRDWRQIEHELPPLLELVEEPERLARLRALRTV